LFEKNNKFNFFKSNKNLHPQKSSKKITYYLCDMTEAENWLTCVISSQTTDRLFDFNDLHLISLTPL